MYPWEGVNFAMINKHHYKYLNTFLTVYHFYSSKPIERTKLTGSKGGRVTRTKSQMFGKEVKR